MLFKLNTRLHETIPPANSFCLSSMRSVPPVRIDALQDVQADWLQPCQHSSHVINIVHLIHSVLCSELFQALQKRCNRDTSVQQCRPAGYCWGPDIETQQ